MIILFPYFIDLMYHVISLTDGYDQAVITKKKTSCNLMYRPGNVPIEQYAVITWCFLKGCKLQLNNIY
jgi:hypothetical protein